MPEPVFFATAVEFRAWLEANHARESETWVKFYRKAAGKGGMSYPEALDELLCFGWIDGVRKTLDHESYVNRFSPRKKGSTWSQVNIRHMERLIAAGKVHPAGMAAFEARTADRLNLYSSEQESIAFTPELEAQFAAEPDAWAWFQAQPPGWRKVATWWVVSAKRDETRRRRLQQLIEASLEKRRDYGGPSPKKASPGADDRGVLG